MTTAIFPRYFSILKICLVGCLTLYLLTAVKATAENPDDPGGSSHMDSVKPASASIFYFTNRARLESQTGTTAFGGSRGTPRFGKCEVEFTPIPFASDLASKLPFYLKEETNSVAVVEQNNIDMFWKQLEQSVQATSSQSVVLFVHGYSYGFERACDMAAEMQRSLNEKATVVAFTWPSNGLPSDYVSDIADVEWSVSLLAEYIRELGERLGSDRVQLVAHSMGSRGAIFALLLLAAEPVDQPVISQLVLLAPDFDSQTFLDLLPRIRSMSGKITLYASDKDTLLKFSRQFNGYPRLGEAGEYLTVVEGIETIDVSPSGRYQITGHEYFFFNPRVVNDLVLLVGHGVDASMRPGLEPKQHNRLPYWQLR
jgi:esterase/lipase superfamily enzyme